jgi:hypothetical protein
MKITSACALFVAATLSLAAQEEKKVPKDSVRVSIPGCTKDYIFTVAPRTEDQPGSVDVPVGMHIRMTGPKKVINEIRAREGSMIVLTGLMKKSQPQPGGISIGGGIRIAPASPGVGGRPSPMPSNQAIIDVEGWRPGTGECSTR